MTVKTPFEPVTLFYHVTHLKNVEIIEREGLRADVDGNIYAFTDMLVADNIARSQVFANPYALFQICPSGIVGNMFVDDVAEFSSPLHCIIQQDRIEPRYLRYLGTMAVQDNTLTPWQWMVCATRKLTRHQIEAAYGNAREMKEGCVNG